MQLWVQLRYLKTNKVLRIAFWIGLEQVLNLEGRSTEGRQWWEDLRGKKEEVFKKSCTDMKMKKRRKLSKEEGVYWKSWMTTVE